MGGDLRGIYVENGKSEVIENVRIFEQEQENHLEKSRKNNEKKLEQIKSSIGTRLKEVEEKALAERKQKILEATKKAKEESKASIKQYEEQTHELEKKSEKNKKKAVDECFSVLMED